MIDKRKKKWFGETEKGGRKALVFLLFLPVKLKRKAEKKKGNEYINSSVALREALTSKWEVVGEG